MTFCEAVLFIFWNQNNITFSSLFLFVDLPCFVFMYTSTFRRSNVASIKTKVLELTIVFRE